MSLILKISNVNIYYYRINYLMFNNLHNKDLIFKNIKTFQIHMKNNKNTKIDCKRIALSFIFINFIIIIKNIQINIKLQIF